MTGNWRKVLKSIQNVVTSQCAFFPSVAEGRLRIVYNCVETKGVNEAIQSGQKWVGKMAIWEKALGREVGRGTGEPWSDWRCCL